MFTVFKKVTNPKSDINDEDVAKVSDYVFCRWLSGSPRTVQIAQMFNLYHNIPVGVKLKTAQKLIDGRIKYIPYPKSQNKDEDTNIQLMCEYFNISIAKAKMYLELISDDDLKRIKTAIDSKNNGVVK